MSDTINIKIAKRPWYEWVLWALWVLVLFFVAQNAIASSQELEPRAAAIFWMTFVVLFLAGVIVWFVRKPRQRKMLSGQETPAGKPVHQA